jgi:hypothetical protein
MDEPLIQPLARCVAGLEQTDPAEWVPALAAACDGECAPAVRCQRAFPQLLDTVVQTVRDHLPAGIPVALNLTGDLGADLRPNAVLSWTWNWVGREHPAVWSHRFFERLLTHEGPIAAYAPVAGASRGWQPRRAPSAAAHRAQIALLAASGAQTIRLFTWPPNGPAMLDAIQGVARFLAQRWPALGALRQVSTTHRAVRLFHTAQDTALVVNPTARRLQVPIGAGPGFDDIAWGAGRLRVIDGLTYAELPPFGVLLTR